MYFLAVHSFVTIPAYKIYFSTKHLFRQSLAKPMEWTYPQSYAQLWITFCE